MAPLATARGGQAAGIQRLVMGLVVLVVVGVLGSNARMVMKYMAESRSSFASAWIGDEAAAHAAGRTRLTDPPDMESVGKFVAQVRKGEIRLIGQQREHLLDRLRQLGYSKRGSNRSLEYLLQLPLSAVLATPAPTPTPTAQPRGAQPRSRATSGGSGAEPALRIGPEQLLPLRPPGEPSTPPRIFTRDPFARAVRIPWWQKPGAASKPSGAMPTLDDALAKIPKPNNTVIATFVNMQRFDFGLSWVRRCEKLGLTNLVVGALDPSALGLLQKRGVATFQMGEGAKRAPLPGQLDYGWNSPNFKKMGIEKVQLLHDLLGRNLSALLMDADAVLIRNPLPFFARYDEADILVTTDYIGAPSLDGGIDPPHNLVYTMNIGVIFARPRAEPLARAWVTRLVSGSLQWDQNVFFQLMSSRKDGAGFADQTAHNARLPLPPAFTPAARQKKLGLAFDGTLVAGVLPSSLFCTGFTFVSGYCDRNKAERPFAFHACWLFYEAHGKRVRLRSLGLWDDEPDYYRQGEGGRDGGFLYLADGGWLGKRGRDESLTSPPFTVEKHMRLVHEQLVYVRSGMLLAQALRRQFVMPRMLCLYDKWWAEHNGTIPASVMDQPIQGARAHARAAARASAAPRAPPRARAGLERARPVRLRLARADCPMDHILDVQLLNQKQQWLPRQHSFVQHEDMPADVNASRAHVSLGAFSAAEGKEGRSHLGALVDALTPAPGGALSAGSARILGVTDIPDIFRMLSADEQVRTPAPAPPRPLRRRPQPVCVTNGRAPRAHAAHRPRPRRTRAPGAERLHEASGGLGQHDVLHVVAPSERPHLLRPVLGHCAAHRRAGPHVHQGVGAAVRQLEAAAHRLRVRLLQGEGRQPPKGHVRARPEATLTGPNAPSPTNGP